MNGDRGSSGMVLRLQVMPARSSTSWASLPVSSASKERRSQRTWWFSVPPDTSRMPSAATAVGQRPGIGHHLRRVAANSGRAASAKATALPAMTFSSGPPCSPGKMALSMALAYSAAAHDGAAPRAPAASCGW